MESKSNLPWDIICYEILTRTSMETIGRFRAASKDSNHITYTPLFIQSFHQRTKRVSGYFIQYLDNAGYSSTTFLCIDQPDANCEISLNFMPVPVKIQASSNAFGLLLCVEDDPIRFYEHPPRYYMCKPSTRQWQQLPKPKTRYPTVSTAMMVLRADPLYYKIVRLSRDSDSYYVEEGPVADFDSKNSVWKRMDHIGRLRVEVFDSQSWVWRQLDDIVFSPGVFLRNVFLGFAPVGASGALHWLTTDNRILAFDVEKEIWNTFMLPKSFCDEGRYYSFVTVMQYKGRLAAMGTIDGCKDESLEIWVMENYSRKTWTNVGYFKCAEKWGRPVGFYDDETIVYKGRCSDLILHKFKNKVNNVSQLKSKYGREPLEVFCYESDCQLCDGWQSEEMGVLNWCWISKFLN